MTTAVPATTPAAARLLPGALFAIGIGGTGALASHLAADAGVVVSPLVAALLLGLVLAQFRTWPATVRPGIDFACRPLLRFAIVLLGLRIGLPQIAAIGTTGAASVAAIVAGTLGAGYFVSRWLGLSRDQAWLLAAGHAICGAAAIAAADSVLKAKDREVTQSLTMVTLFGTLAMLLCPLVGKALAMTATTYGFWAGGSVHEVAQAVAAGFALGDGHGEAASLVKMVRVAFLLPLGLFLAGVVARRNGGGATRRIVVPWFVVGFAALAVVDACGLVPAPIAGALRHVGTWAMTVAMAALGLKSSLRDLLTGGWRPIAAAAATTLVVSGLAFALAPCAGTGIPSAG